MSEVFDAYHKWLGIPPNEQPPDHYRLLGVRRFESDLDVIEHAADQRMAHIRSFQSGPHAMQSQRLLNELSAARRNLFDSDWKAKHDEAVRATLKVQEPGVVASPPPPGMPPLSDDQDQAHSEIPCPTCGGPLPGEYRKCMHCRSELAWKNGVPYEAIAGKPIIAATLVQESVCDVPIIPVDHSELSVTEMLESERAEGEKLRYSDMPPHLRPNELQMESLEQIRMKRIRIRTAEHSTSKFRQNPNGWAIQEPALLGGIGAICWALFLVLPFIIFEWNDVAKLPDIVVVAALLLELSLYFCALWLTVH